MLKLYNELTEKPMAASLPRGASAKATLFLRGSFYCVSRASLPLFIKQQVLKLFQESQSAGAAHP